MDPEPGTAEATREAFKRLFAWLFVPVTRPTGLSTIPTKEDPDFGRAGRAWPDFGWMGTRQTSFAHQFTSDYDDVEGETKSSATQEGRSKPQPKQGA
jgi:hypothetical protein